MKGWNEQIRLGTDSTKLVPHLDGVEEIHEALSTPSQLTSYDLYQNQPKVITTCQRDRNSTKGNRSSKKQEAYSRYSA